jgi:thiol-disulfide isomerase/thioredoxin
MKLVLLYLTLFTLPLLGQISNEIHKLPLKQGDWTAYLQLNEKDRLPFKLIVKKSVLIIQNSEELIPLSAPRIHQDTFILDFPAFHSSLHFSVKDKKNIVGYWINYNKGSRYKVPFNARFGYTSRFEKTDCTPPINVDGQWKVKFDYLSEQPEMSIGIFQQANSCLSGTFLTETGDYRFLQGNQFGKDFSLSCFDGAHAFLFKAVYQNDTLFGRFLSGNHWQGIWQGTKDEKFTLQNADSITRLQNTDLFTFSLNDIYGNKYLFPNENTKQKVVIIQIMGTWCPNCMDETKYYKELYSKYHHQGLEIIAIGYETGETFEDYSKKIKLLKERLNLDFTFLVGGPAKKSVASEQFSMLNEVISFPTSIFIGKDGTVKRVHTGFNGPGTGNFYTEYVEKTNRLIESLLQN